MKNITEILKEDSINEAGDYKFLGSYFFGDIIDELCNIIEDAPTNSELTLDFGDIIRRSLRDHNYRYYNRSKAKEADVKQFKRDAKKLGELIIEKLLEAADKQLRVDSY